MYIACGLLHTLRLNDLGYTYSQAELDNDTNYQCTQGPYAPYLDAFSLFGNYPLGGLDMWDSTRIASVVGSPVPTSDPGFVTGCDITCKGGECMYEGVLCQVFDVSSHRATASMGSGVLSIQDMITHRKDHYATIYNAISTTATVCEAGNTPSGDDPLSVTIRRTTDDPVTLIEFNTPSAGTAVFALLSLMITVTAAHAGASFVVGMLADKNAKRVQKSNQVGLKLT
ncbi:hypothetical protein KIPB_004369 [Kipferlia bialata]|uniref:Uncharacterized protein n=1 Tax=Kipferlia bialata TaxID=797122 RepID=A0A9K3CTM0_9EUKA|nr:hypothetical protein KIPB_004369 [Kipferlia bialata]|eukprot:g4369.t1